MFNIFPDNFLFYFLSISFKWSFSPVQSVLLGGLFHQDKVSDNVLLKPVTGLSLHVLLEVGYVAHAGHGGPVNDVGVGAIRGFPGVDVRDVGGGVIHVAVPGLLLDHHCEHVAPVPGNRTHHSVTPGDGEVGGGE